MARLEDNKKQAELDKFLQERVFIGRQFDKEKQNLVLLSILEDKNKKKQKRKVFAFTPYMFAIIAVASIVVMAWPLLNKSMMNQPGTIMPSPDSSSDPKQHDEQVLAQTRDGLYRLIAYSDGGGGDYYTEWKIMSNEEELYVFKGYLHKKNAMHTPKMQLADLQNDGQRELVIIWGNPLSNGVWSEEAHVLNTRDWTELSLPSYELLLKQKVNYQFVSHERFDGITVEINVAKHELALDKQKPNNEQLLSTLQYSLSYTMGESADRLMVKADVYVGEENGLFKLGTFGEQWFNKEGGQLSLGEPSLFVFAPDIEGEIPLYAMDVEGEFISLWSSDQEIDLGRLFGKPIKETVKRLGDDGQDAGPFTGTYVKELIYDGLEIRLSSGDGKEYRIVSMRLSSDKYATSLGIRVGDSAEQVERAYPSIEHALDGREAPGDYAYVFGHNMIGLLIDMKDNQVRELYFEYLMD